MDASETWRREMLLLLQLEDQAEELQHSNGESSNDDDD